MRLSRNADRVLRARQAARLLVLAGGALCMALSSCDQHKSGSNAVTSSVKETAAQQDGSPPEPYSDDVSELVALAQAPDLSPASWEGPSDREGSGGQALALRSLFGSPEQRKWAAFALARHCTLKSPDRVIAALTNATALWLTESPSPSPDLLKTAGWAIGSCARPESEEILRRWLSAEAQTQDDTLLLAAALGLAAYVDRRGQLSERTQTAVLDAASREKNAALLLPLARMGRLSEAVGAHLLEVAGSLLTSTAAAGRRSAIFALGNAGASAAAPLAQILSASHFSIQEHAAAAQALGRLGSAGQRGLDQALHILLEQGLPLSAENPRWIAILETARQLESPSNSRDELRKLDSVVLPSKDDEKKQAQRRRLIELRCRAADLLAQDASLASALLDCDPDKGRSFQLAQLRVLDRGALEDKRLQIFIEHLQSADPLVRQAALRLLASHPEVPHQGAVLGQALQADNWGTVTSALQLITAYPSRLSQASAEDADSRDAIIKLLADLLSGEKSKAMPEETKAAALLAAGALGALNLKATLNSYCNGPERVLWRSAEQALALLGSSASRCPQQAPTADVAAGAPAHFVKLPVHLVVDSPVGELRLSISNRFAPRSIAHILSLVDAGSFDNLPIGASKLGFAVQFGDKNGDGYDDAPIVGLPFEVSPESLEGYALGISSFAPGAENRQLFVTVSEAPQLMGSRVILGEASGPWELLVPGDVLRSVKRLPK